MQPFCKHSTENSTGRKESIGRKLLSEAKHNKACSARKHTDIHAKVSAEQGKLGNDIIRKSRSRESRSARVHTWEDGCVWAGLLSKHHQDPGGENFFQSIARTRARTRTPHAHACRHARTHARMHAHTFALVDTKVGW